MEARLRPRHAATQAPQPLHRSTSIRVARSSLSSGVLARPGVERVVPARVTPAVPAIALRNDLRCNKSLLAIGYLCLSRPLPYPYRPADAEASMLAFEQDSLRPPCSIIRKNAHAVFFKRRYVCMAFFSNGAGGRQRQNKASSGTNPASSATSRRATSPTHHQRPILTAQVKNMSAH